MKILLILIFLLAMSSVKSQEIMNLYPNHIPNSIPTPNREYSTSNDLVDSLTFRVSVPTLQVFHPPSSQQNRAAVIICPGGGYGVLLTKREGSDVARRFAQMGITGIVLKYRLPDSVHLVNPEIGPLQDLQMAIHTVRQNAEKWGLDPQKIGVLGFSAGGHLAASSGVHHRTFWVDSSHTAKIRPDFLILVNPVISFTDKMGHIGSRNNLMGKRITDEGIQFHSNELNVDNTTPPTFLVHNNPDSVVTVDHSLSFYQELRHKAVPVELHIYERGEHGFLTWPSFEEWFGRMMHWMKGRSLMD